MVFLICFFLRFVQAGANDLVPMWNEVLLRAVRYASVAPPVASRQMAVVHSAIFEAANGVDQRYRSYRVNAPPPRDASMEAAVSAAAYHSLRTLFPKSASTLDSHYRAVLSVIPDTMAKTNGVEWGRQVATHFLELRQFDGSGQSVAYVKEDRPGYWIRTPPNYDPPLLPNWGRLQPFGIPSVEGFRPPPPPALASTVWAEEYNLVKRIGATNSVSRTPEQREIAKFWADGAGTETPPGHWNHIAQQVVAKLNLDTVESARLFAALNVAMADACIVCWDAKYRYNWWRPITAIRAGNADGNPATDPEPNWTPLIPTPPFPEHTSGHSSFSGAAAAVLAEATGSDAFSFTLSSDGLPGVVRRFDGFSEAAREAGMSRIYGGIHFPSANVNGLENGRRVGRYVMQHLFKILDKTSSGP